MANWVLLKAYDSEAEARVVESFLQAHEIPVQLLGTYARYTVMVPGRDRVSGMRLLVPEDQRARAEELLAEQARATHLDIVTEGEPPRLFSGRDRIVAALLILFVIVVLAIKFLA